jgi:hypothetical protein
VGVGPPGPLLETGWWIEEEMVEKMFPTPPETRLRPTRETAAIKAIARAYSLIA